MADIPSNIQKMNDDEISFEASLSEQLLNKIGANINALIDLSGNFQIFTANGTWDVPDGITFAQVIACGGGGGGAGGWSVPERWLIRSGSTPDLLLIFS